MLNIDISNISLIVIVIILSLLLFLISIMMFISFIYHTKRKYDSINQYSKLISDKILSYEEMRSKYEKNFYSSGIKSQNKDDIVLKLIKSKINNFKSSD